MSIKKKVFSRIRFLFLDYKILSDLEKIEKSTIDLNELVQWTNTNFRVPAPQFIKNSIFLKHTSDSTIWIETGTYKGTSTEFLSRNSKFVYTIEPEINIFNTTKNKLLNKGLSNIEFYNGTSEDVLEKLITKLDGEKLSIWLDGHFSGGDTYLGKKSTPILEELRIIQQNIAKFKEISILIDDIRDFNQNDKTNQNDYPDKSEIVKWAIENGLNWEIQYDILILSK